VSHGGGLGEIKADPNLTPLLDVVLQLIMFFMVGVTFASNQFSPDIDLPTAQSARPMEKGITDTLFLNLNKDGQLQVVGNDKPLTTPDEISFYLKQQHADLERLDKSRGGKGTVNTLLILRADQRAEYRKVYDLLRHCKDAGFSKIQLRAKTRG